MYSLHMFTNVAANFLWSAALPEQCPVVRLYNPFCLTCSDISVALFIHILKKKGRSAGHSDAVTEKNELPPCGA